MRILQCIFILLIMLSSCNNTQKKGTDTTEDDIIAAEAIINMTKFRDTAAYEEYERDMRALTSEGTKIEFADFELTISEVEIWNKEEILDTVLKDSINLILEIGKTIEGQLLIIVTDKLSNVRVEQRYETSITIMNEGPHCDLLEWMHYNSEWKQLQKNEDGQFICDKYDEKDQQKFIDVDIEELRKAVREHCNENWHELAEEIQSPTEYPSGVGISHYFLRITGNDDGTNKQISKIIAFELAMGC